MVEDDLLEAYLREMAVQNAGYYLNTFIDIVSLYTSILSLTQSSTTNNTAASIQGNNLTSSLPILLLLVYKVIISHLHYQYYCC